jgi:L-seryl-tRNA(Ser) seleniumtransferase
VSSKSLRDLPSVNEILESLSADARQLPHALITDEIRHAIETARISIRDGVSPIPSIQQTVEAALKTWTRPSQVHVINATGVILHTNLGRAPLPPLNIPGGYTNLEYDLATGDRGKRDMHVDRLLEAILGRPAITVNNGAAALFLVLNELALGGEAIVSRGELIEIGDGFRIPEIMERSGTQLREVGTTNRTRIEDYRDAITERTRVLLRVHPSNFRMTGFTARPDLSELVALGRDRGIPVYEDLGSGCVVDLSVYGVDEPLVRNSLRAGANLVSFSGDKLLGGPQAGIIAGDRELVRRVRRNPLFRVLRQDKLIHHAMEATLRAVVLGNYGDVPALRMIQMTADEVKSRAEAVARRLTVRTTIREGQSVIGGGATPEQPLPTWLIAIEDRDAHAEAQRLRLLTPPVIARIERDRVVFDLRTVFPEEEQLLVQALL